MTRAENYVTLEFLSRSSNEGFARVAAAGFAAQLDPTLDELGDIKTAVSEAVTNAIVHAYPNELGRIVLKMKLLPGSVLELSVRDWGRGIDNVEQARKILTALQWGPFIKSDNSQLIPLRQLELFRAKMVLEGNKDMDAKEKAAKIAEIERKLAELGK